MYKVGIIGFGVVGKAIYNTLIKKYSIVKYDKFTKLDDFELMSSCDFIFISVPSPFDYHEREVDDSAILESLVKLDNLSYKGIVIIKSTLPPGSCDKYKDEFNLEMVFNPEFLRESTTPNEDFENQEIVVIGTSNEDNFNKVKVMYEKVLNSTAVYHHTTNIEAEMIKVSQNTVLASRVAVANVIYDACLSLGLEYNKIREIAFDSFEILGANMVKVPGPDGKRGFGGKCLPKDTLAFTTVHKSNLINEILTYNEDLRDDLNQVLKNYDKKNSINE